MMEWKLFWTAAGAILSASVAALTLTGHLWWGLAVLITVGVTTLVILLAHVVVDACEMWRGATARQRRRVWLGVASAALTYATWTITTIAIPSAWPNILIMVIALAGIVVSMYWLARGLEWRLTSAPAPVRPPHKEEESLLGTKEKVLKAALKRAGLNFVSVLPGADPLRNEAGWQFRIRIVSRSTLSSDDRSGAQAQLTQQNMEPVAIALAEITGRNVESDWVRLRKEREAGVYSVTITNRDLMTEVIPYVDDPTPTSITEPALVGVEIDGREHRERLDQHQRDVGGSTAGKSSLIHCKIAHATRCTDTLVWVGGVQKLYDLVGSWVEPYQDKGLRSPLDWIAHGQGDTLKMMATAMAVARWRQRQPMALRRWRKIILILDEFSFVAQSSQKTLFGGDWATASRLASSLLRGAASGDVYVHFASQRSTTDHYGDQGGDVIANIAVNNAFRSKDFADIGRLTGDYKLPVPKARGEFYRFSDADPLHLKAPYIQSNDPSKPRLHDGATIGDISWSRRHLVAGGLTEVEGLEATDEAYQQRYQAVDAHMMAYLTHGGDIEEVAQTEPTNQGEVYEQVRAELEATVAKAGWDLSKNDPQPAPESAPAPTPARRADAILAALEDLSEEHPEGVGAGHITEALIESGDTNVDQNTISATLSRMTHKGQIHRVASGRYTALHQTNKQTNA